MVERSRWEGIKKQRSEPTDEVRATMERDLALGQLVYDLRVESGLSQSELAEQRMGTTQSVISKLEEGGGARNCIDTLASVATSLGRHTVLSFPTEVPDRLEKGHSGFLSNWYRGPGCRREGCSFCRLVVLYC